MIQAKFKLSTITEHANWGGKIYDFNVVTADSIENKSFAKYTPTGTMTLTVDNPVAQEFLELGKEYVLNFTKVDKE